MGCCSTTLRRSLNLADDEEKVIKRNLELKLIADSYNDTIMRRIKIDLPVVVKWLDNFLSHVPIIRGTGTLVCSHTFNEKEIVAELNQFMVFPSYPGTLEKTMDQLRMQMNRISKRKRSMKRWRIKCIAVVMAITIAIIMASIGLALAGAAPVAVAAAASGATAIKAVEPLVNAALEEKERKLKEEEEEVVEMMRDAEQLMVHEFNGVRRLTKEIINDKYLNFVKHIKAAEKAAPEMEKMIDEIESDARELKGKINLYCYKMEQYEDKFIRMITN